MFKIDTGRHTWMAVKWPGLTEDGQPIQNAIQCKVELVDRKVLQENIRQENAGDADSVNFATQVTKDWREIADENGSPLSYSAENLRRAFEIPGFATGWGTAYLRAWNGQSGIAEKNSVNSPADGQPATAGAAKEA